MTRAEIVAVQRRVGTVPDGFWGPQSIEACQRHLRRLMPEPHPFPRSGGVWLREYYGEPGKGVSLMRVDVAGLGVRYEGKEVRSIMAHVRCAGSLRAALEEIAAGEHAEILGRYAGCYNDRNMRGGSSKSLHAWGAAIDLDPDRNGNRSHWPTRATMPLEVMEAFARQGWLPAGAFWGRDAMHFQATR